MCRPLASSATAHAPRSVRRASASRPSGEWNDDDFDVLADGAVVGRIFKANAAPVRNALDVDMSLRAARGSIRVADHADFDKRDTVERLGNKKAPNRAGAEVHLPEGN